MPGGFQSTFMKSKTIRLACVLLISLEPALANEWSLDVAGSWVELNGSRRLVRGDRKVVSTDAVGGFAPHLTIRHRVSERYSLTLSIFRMETRYTHLEAGGWGTLYLDAHATLLRFSDELNLLSEQALPAGLANINPTPFDLTVSNGLGLRGGVDMTLGENGLFLSPGASLTVAFMPADIIDEPEDPEDGSDIFSPMHPLSIRLGLGYRF